MVDQRARSCCSGPCARQPSWSYSCKEYQKDGIADPVRRSEKTCIAMSCYTDDPANRMMDLIK